MKAKRWISFTCHAYSFPLKFLLTAPAIRLVDEMSHEVSDRYYKLGSSVDITCQVALSFLNTIPSPTTPPSKDRLQSSLPTTTTTTTSTTTIFPFIDTNLIKKTFEQQIPYSGKHNIKWRKDGKDLPKDIKINLRFVWHKIVRSRMESNWNFKKN